MELLVCPADLANPAKTVFPAHLDIPELRERLVFPASACPANLDPLATMAHLAKTALMVIPVDPAQLVPLDPLELLANPADLALLATPVDLDLKVLRPALDNVQVDTLLTFNFFNL